MKFKVELEKIKTRELIAMEKSPMSVGVDLMSRFMVNELGEPIPEDEAYKILIDTNAVEINEYVEQFYETILPKAKGGRS